MERCPSGAKSLALIMHDPDAPRAGGFTHWVIFNIPPTAKGLTEAMPKQAQLTDGTVQGNNGRGEPGYTGPCPPPDPPTTTSSSSMPWTVCSSLE